MSRYSIYDTLSYYGCAAAATAFQSGYDLADVKDLAFRELQAQEAVIPGIEDDIQQAREWLDSL